MLCGVCQAIELLPLSECIPAYQDFIKELGLEWCDERVLFFHYSKFEDLSSSYENGCHFCTMLWHGFVYYKDLFVGCDMIGACRPPPYSQIFLEATFDSRARVWSPDRKRDLIARCAERKFVLSLNDLPCELI